ncbi:MAG: substrate-binding domain-containing protein [Hyphomicrobiaceae bacterium]
MSKFGVPIPIAVAALVMAATAASAQTTLKVDGSTGAMPLVAALANAYEAKIPNLKVEIGKGLGTKARIDALNAGSIDIAVASHGLKTDELVKQGITFDEIARTPVVFGVNSSVPVTNLSQAQICAIYSGNLQNWKEAGGIDLAIAARTRPDTEVDAEVARDGIACLKTLKMPEAVKVMQRGGDMANELAATVGAIGMTTTTVAEQSGGKIKALSLDGVAPTEANVSAGAYRLVREVFLVVKGDASPAVKAFLAFVKSADGAKVIKANGAIPKTAN